MSTVLGSGVVPVLPESQLIGSILREDYTDDPQHHQHHHSHSHSESAPPIQRATSAPPQLDFDDLPTNTAVLTKSTTKMLSPIRSGTASRGSSQSSTATTVKSGNTAATGDIVDTITVNGETVLANDPRLSYEYFAYYYMQRPLDPRLPPPLINWSNFHYAEHNHTSDGVNGSSGGVGGSMTPRRQSLSKPSASVAQSQSQSSPAATSLSSSYSSTATTVPSSTSLSSNHSQHSNYSVQSSPIPSSYYLPMSPVSSPLPASLESFTVSEIQKSFQSLQLQTSPTFASNANTNAQSQSRAGNPPVNPMLAVMGFGASSYRGNQAQSTTQSITSPHAASSNHTGHHRRDSHHGWENSPIAPRPADTASSFISRSPRGGPINNRSPFGSAHTHYHHHHHHHHQSPVLSPTQVSMPMMDSTLSLQYMQDQQRATILSSINNLYIDSQSPVTSPPLIPMTGKLPNIASLSSSVVPIMPSLPMPVPVTLSPHLGQLAHQQQHQHNHTHHHARSAWLDDFRLNRTNERMISIEDLFSRGLLLELSCDQHGSRFIQQRLELSTVEEKSLVLEQLLPHLIKLCQDVFGNYVIQKLIEHGSIEQRTLLLQSLKSSILPLSQHTYGCRVIQKSLEICQAQDYLLSILVSEIQGHVIQCIKDASGNHVIQKIIERCPNSMIQFIVDSIRGQTQALSVHAYGCRVIQRLLEHGSEAQCSAILTEIFHSIDELSRNQFGNYVIQHVLIHGQPAHRSIIIASLKGKLLVLSRHKFASNVVEKCFAHASKDDRQALIDEVMGETISGNGAGGGDSSVLLGMVKDQFANYVVQRLIDVLDADQLCQFVRRIKKFVPQLRKIPYGKHIIAKIERMTGQTISEK